MKKGKGFIVCSALNFIGGTCFLIGAVMYQEQEFSTEVPQYVQWISKYGFYVAAACLLIAGAGFLYTYFRNKRK